MRRVLPWATAVLAVALLVAGALVFVTTDPATPTDFGRYAYEPLPSSTPAPYTSTLTLAFDDGRVVWSDGRLLGAGLGVGGLGVGGLLLAAGLGGWAVGRRPRRTPGAR